MNQFFSYLSGLTEVVGACMGNTVGCGTIAVDGAETCACCWLFDVHWQGLLLACPLVDAWATACPDVIVAGIVYGATVGRIWAANGFGAFGAQTAQGRSPTKRSPRGLASGVCWDVIFNGFYRILA